ncbi:hypothetical protein H5185_20050 [Shewanella sp. SG44-6]|jgi:hypothetical protein|uniref:hypothetical protein n=1 Tax=Shewanella sp. SG44-6 TaxID=2760959 RepID=UPI0016040A5A|nr:hypothetical protein [Shewanella sp. SG44-6]MBB1391683.1 hypothetical protein [Shewanella sp. SG44-6]
MYLPLLIIPIIIASAEVYVACKLTPVQYLQSKEIDDSKIGETYWDDGISRIRGTVNNIRATYLAISFLVGLVTVFLSNLSS